MLQYILSIITAIAFTTINCGGGKANSGKTVKKAVPPPPVPKTVERNENSSGAGSVGE